MAYTVSLVHEGDFDGSANGNTYEYVYRVVSDTPNPGKYNVVLAVLAELGNPKVGDNHPTDSSAVFLGCNAKTEDDDDNMSFLVTVNYGQNNKAYEHGFVDSTYTDEETDYYSINEIYVRDVEGFPVVNSAGDPPATARSRRVAVAKYRFTKYQSEFDSAWAGQFTNTVNANRFKDWPAGTVLCSGIKSVPKRDSAFPLGKYFIVTYEFDIRKDGWDDVYIDEGYRELKTTGEGEEQTRELVNILVDGKPTTDPCFLDGTGKRLPVDGIPVYITRKPYFRVPFVFPGL